MMAQTPNPFLSTSPSPFVSNGSCWRTGGSPFPVTPDLIRGPASTRAWCNSGTPGQARGDASEAK